MQKIENLFSVDLQTLLFAEGAGLNFWETLLIGSEDHGQLFAASGCAETAESDRFYGRFPDRTSPLSRSLSVLYWLRHCSKIFALHGREIMVVTSQMRH